MHVGAICIRCLSIVALGELTIISTRHKIIFHRKPNDCTKISMCHPKVFQSNVQALGNQRKIKQTTFIHDYRSLRPLSLSPITTPRMPDLELLMFAARLGLQRVLRVDGQLVSEGSGQRRATGARQTGGAEPARRLTCTAWRNDPARSGQEAKQWIRIYTVLTSLPDTREQR